MTWVFWLYASIAVPWVLVALIYGLRSPWRRSWVGRGQFVTFVSLAAALAVAALFRAHHFQHRVAVTIAVIVLGGIGVAGLGQLVNVLRLQRDQSPRRKG